jgi:hypothetical protein
MPPLATLRTVILAALLALAGPAAAEGEAPSRFLDDRPGTGWRLFSPCERNCAIAAFAGPYIDNSMAQVLYQSPELPFTWDYRGSDGLIGISASRYAGTLWGRIDIEPEIGLAQRVGRQSGVTEVWAALYARWRGFPWDTVVTTTFAISTGLNYASEVSRVERERAEEKGYSGNRLLHYFSPEITFALPDRPDIEMLFRFHHRSGADGWVGDPGGGAHYGTVGLRIRF